MGEYIIVTTLCNKIEIANRIVDNLLEKYDFAEMPKNKPPQKHAADVSQ